MYFVFLFTSLCFITYLCIYFILGTTLPIPQDPAEPQTPISMNNFTVDNLMAPMLAASGYPTGAVTSRPDIYRTSCTQPIVSQPYASVPQTVFPSPAGVPVDDMYNRSTWYQPDVGQTSPLDYQQPTRYDNRSPSCQPPLAFRDTYKPYGYN